MLDNWLDKTKLKKSLERFIKKVLVGKLSADSLTLLGLLFGLISALCIFLSKILNPEFVLIMFALIFMLISFIFDAFDGIVARLEESTIFGGILDMFSDRSVEVILIISLISTDPVILMWPGIFVLGSIILCITIFLIIGSAVNKLGTKNLEENEKLIYYSSGLMERGETFLFLFFITLLIAWRRILMWIFSLLIFITALQRFYTAYQLFYKKDNNNSAEYTNSIRK